MSYRVTDLPVALLRQLTEHLPKASDTAHAAHRRFTPAAEYEPRTVQVDDVLMAVLVIALIAWML